MRRGVLFFLLMCACCFSAKAQDSIASNRNTVHATMLGIGKAFQLDTYLSPLEYTGPQFSFLYETLRPTHYAKGCVTVQTNWLFNLSYTSNAPACANYIGGNLGYRIGWHYNWKPVQGLRLMAGGKIEADIGGRYNNRNSNNPAQGYASLDVAISMLAIYKWQMPRYSMTFRYQFDMPLMGAMFSPNYGQSYYEIFSKGHYDHNICFTYPGNAPIFHQLLTVDFPIKGFTFRVGYLCDIVQSQVNGLKRHEYTHAFLLGWVKHFTFKKRKETQEFIL